MFDKQVYISRRKRLLEQVKSGVILLMGNSEASCNYPDNQYQSGSTSPTWPRSSTQKAAKNGSSAMTSISTSSSGWGRSR